MFAIVSRLAAIPASLLLCALGAADALAQTTTSPVQPDEQPPTAGGFIVGLVLLTIVLVAIPLGQRIARRRREAPPKLPAIRSERTAAAAAAAGIPVAEIRADAEELFRMVQAAWDARDAALLERLVDPKLLASWEQARPSREDFWASPVIVEGRVDVEYAGTGTAPNGNEQVLVRVQTLLDGWAPRGDPLPRRRWLR